MLLISEERKVKMLGDLHATYFGKSPGAPNFLEKRYGISDKP